MLPPVVRASANGSRRRADRRYVSISNCGPALATVATTRVHRHRSSTTRTKTLVTNGLRRPAAGHPLATGGLHLAISPRTMGAHTARLLATLAPQIDRISQPADSSERGAAAPACRICSDWSPPASASPDLAHQPQPAPHGVAFVRSPTTTRHVAAWRPHDKRTAEPARRVTELAGDTTSPPLAAPLNGPARSPTETSCVTGHPVDHEAASASQAPDRQVRPAIGRRRIAPEKWKVEDGARVSHQMEMVFQR